MTYFWIKSGYFSPEIEVVNLSHFKYVDLGWWKNPSNRPFSLGRFAYQPAKNSAY